MENREDQVEEVEKPRKKSRKAKRRADIKKKIGGIDFLDTVQITIIASIVFVLFYFFFGEYNFFVRGELGEDREVLYRRIDSIENQITSDSILIYQLKNSNDALEKYVRENFYMHRDDEEVYIIDTLVGY